MDPLRKAVERPGRAIVLALLLAVPAAGTPLSGAGRALAAEGTAAAKAQDPAAVPAPGTVTADNRVYVEARQVNPRDFRVMAGYVGHVLPWERVVLRAEIEGVAERVDFREGEAVRKGQVLAQLSGEQRRVQVRRARSDLKLAERAYARARELFGKQLISDAALDEAVNRRDAARYGLRMAEIELDKSLVKTPIAGRIKERAVEPGEFLNKGQRIAEILDLSRLRVEFNVPEREFRHFALDKPATVTVDALPGRESPATVHRIGLEADLKSRTFPVEVALDNPGARLRPGMLARVTLALVTHRAQLLVPRHAVLERERGRVLFVARNGRAEEREVTLGVSSGDEVQVTAGLRAGDWVIVAGHRRLTPGEPVRVRRIGR